MITITHKLYPTIKQKNFLEECLWSSIGIENWVINQIKNELSDNYIPLRFMKPLQLRSILGKKIKGHSEKCKIPNMLLHSSIHHVIEGFKRHGIDKLHYKSQRQKKSFYFIGDMYIDRDGRIKLPLCKTTFKISESNKFQGKLKKVTLMKKFNGWYASCVYDEVRKPIECTNSKVEGVDPGLSTSLTFSNGETIQLQRFNKKDSERVSKMQRKSKNSKKLKRIHAKNANRRLDQHHKVTTALAKQYKTIYWSNDNFKTLSKKSNKLGKSYSELSLGKFRDILETKLASRTDESSELIKVSNKYSTQTCHTCTALSGPSGKDMLGVREWTCQSCGMTHDRDINASIITKLLGLGVLKHLKGKIVFQKSKLESSVKRKSSVKAADPIGLAA